MTPPSLGRTIIYGYTANVNTAQSIYSLTVYRLTFTIAPFILGSNLRIEEAEE
jgi:hypothetical protein